MDQNQPSLELLEFLGFFEDRNGEWVDPEMFQDDRNGDFLPGKEKGGQNEKN